MPRHIRFAARVVTFANVRFIHMLANWIAHMHQGVHRQFPFEVQALDNETYTVCLRMLSSEMAGSCVRAPCCEVSQGIVARTMAERALGLTLYEAIAIYKIRYVVQLLEAYSEAVLVLDSTALVFGQSCFDEWIAYPEDIVSSVEHLNGCPMGVSGRLGAVLNTGATLYRPGSLDFLRTVLRRHDEPKFALNKRRYKFHCYDQELINQQFVLDGFRWETFPTAARVPPSNKSLHGGLTVRFLKYARWPRDYTTGAATWFGAIDNRTEEQIIDQKNESRYQKVLVHGKPGSLKFIHAQRKDACLFHPWVHAKYGSPTAYSDLYLQENSWYL